jgi:hypothetical protein
MSPICPRPLCQLASEDLCTVYPFTEHLLFTECLLFTKCQMGR